MSRDFTLALWVVASLTFFSVLDSRAEPDERPRLVLQITVDQLRGDMIPRFLHEFGAGGFLRLLKHGIHYANAHYEMGNTYTVSGHAVLVTGANTAEHGMVANGWFDREIGKYVYSTADPRYTPLGEPQESSGGMSPVNLTSTTLGDELIMASGHRSRAFAIAGKDRGAIMPAGHLGKAFWFSGASGRFISSTYYYNEFPGWAASWNDVKHPDRYRGIKWTPLRKATNDGRSAENQNVHARPNDTLGRTFPHSLVAESDSAFISALRFTPFLDELTAAFAQELIANERLGQRGVTDYLSVSFSATDYIGHNYGPNSPEAEDNLRRLDATLSELLEFADRAIGLQHTLIVLSADHGVDDIPEERRAFGYAAERIYPDKLLARVNVALKQRLGVTDDLVAAFAPPGFYFDRTKTSMLNLDPAATEAALADELRTVPGIAYAFTRSDLMTGRVPHTPLIDRVQRSFHPTRSGDVVIVQSQYWLLSPDPEAYAAMHGSPYSYDTYVPIILAGANIEKMTSYDAVSPSQIAPTLAALLNIKPPSGCTCAAPLPHALH